MTQVIVDNNLTDLQRAVIVDAGSGQPAVLVTTTLPTPARLFVGAFDQLTTTDVLTTPVLTTFSYQAYAEDVVATTESLTMLIQDYSASPFEQEFVSENVVVQVPGTVQTNPLFDTVTITELTTVASGGANPPSALFEASTVTENVTTDPVPNPSATETSAVTEDTTAEVVGP